MSFVGLVRGAAVHCFRDAAVSPALDADGAPQRFVWFVRGAGEVWVPTDLRLAGERCGAKLPVEFFSPRFADAWSTLAFSAAWFVHKLGERATAEPASSAAMVPADAVDPNVRRWWLDEEV